MSGNRVGTSQPWPDDAGLTGSITGFSQDFIYVHDPLVDKDMGKTITDCVNMPILRKDPECS